MGREEKRSEGWRPRPPAGHAHPTRRSRTAPNSNGPSERARARLFAPPRLSPRGGRGRAGLTVTSGHLLLLLRAPPPLLFSCQSTPAPPAALQAGLLSRRAPSPQEPYEAQPAQRSALAAGKGRRCVPSNNGREGGHSRMALWRSGGAPLSAPDPALPRAPRGRRPAQPYLLPSPMSPDSAPDRPASPTKAPNATT